jgi:hypothetical protein
MAAIRKPERLVLNNLMHNRVILVSYDACVLKRDFTLVEHSVSSVVDSRGAYAALSNSYVSSSFILPIYEIVVDCSVLCDVGSHFPTFRVSYCTLSRSMW